MCSQEIAAHALANLATNDATRAAIAEFGGIAPLVAMVSNGTRAQKENAAAALRVLAANEANKVAIARAGGIAPLIAMTRDGTAAQKKYAARTYLCLLTYLLAYLLAYLLTLIETPLRPSRPPQVCGAHAGVPRRQGRVWLQRSE